MICPAMADATSTKTGVFLLVYVKMIPAQTQKTSASIPVWMAALISWQTVSASAGETKLNLS